MSPKHGTCHHCNLAFLYNSLTCACTNCSATFHTRSPCTPPISSGRWTCAKCSKTSLPIKGKARDIQAALANPKPPTPRPSRIPKPSPRVHTITQPPSANPPTLPTTTTPQVHDMTKRIEALEQQVTDLKQQLSALRTPPLPPLPLLPTPSLTRAHLAPRTPHIHHTQNRAPLLPTPLTAPVHRMPPTHRPSGNEQRGPLQSLQPGPPRSLPYPSFTQMHGVLSPIINSPNFNRPLLFTHPMSSLSLRHGSTIPTPRRTPYSQVTSSRQGQTNLNHPNTNVKVPTSEEWQSSHAATSPQQSPPPTLPTETSALSTSSASQ
eukprot:GHVN01009032.1.p1 GENE.GHVN01009032.1~~GHVN01009032.1.p1  ORF type:complete len:320 (-),score=32.96 GHVN01009032.1:174-1133(-)